MKERILEFLRAENKSSAQFAVEIGVQPSGISHILSGRNNPSLDFVLRMLEKYKYLSTEWLLFGRGKMYREMKMPTLFDNLTPAEIDESMRGRDQKKEAETAEPVRQTGEYQKTSGSIKNLTVKKIVWFYDNNEFEEFSPAGDRL